MSSVMNDRLSSAAIPAPSRSSSGGSGVVVVMMTDAAGLHLGGCLGGSGVCVAASKTGHESRLGGSGLNHVVVASGMHIDSLFEDWYVERRVV